MEEIDNSNLAEAANNFIGFETEDPQQQLKLLRHIDGLILHYECKKTPILQELNSLNTITIAIQRIKEIEVRRLYRMIRGESNDYS